MREEDSNWFSKWEEELPSPEELMPLSQTLITPDLAIAFDIPNPSTNHSPQLLHQTLTPPPPQPSNNNNSSEFVDSAELGGGGGSGGDEPARTLKRPRLVWTPQLHKRFVDAVAHLGIKNAVPKTIMQLMSVDGLTRENVASHLQKYRLYLKRMQGISSGGGGGGGASGGIGSDPATDHLFASSAVPAHFLHPSGGGRPGPDHFLPTFVPYHHHPPPPQPQQQQYRQIGQIGHIGLQPNGHIGLQSNGQFEHPFMSARPVLHRIGGGPVGHHNPVVPYVEDVESGTAANGRKVLTLFPTGDD